MAEVQQPRTDPRPPEPRWWLDVVSACLEQTRGPVRLDWLYALVEANAPEHVRRNPHWRDKVRQQCQVLERRGLARHVDRGIWEYLQPAEQSAEVHVAAAA